MGARARGRSVMVGGLERTECSGLDVGSTSMGVEDGAE